MAAVSEHSAVLLAWQSAACRAKTRPAPFYKGSSGLQQPTRLGQDRGSRAPCADACWLHLASDQQLRASERPRLPDDTGFEDALTPEDERAAILCLARMRPPTSTRPTAIRIE